jgi:hypothetical protein
MKSSVNFAFKERTQFALCCPQGSPSHAFVELAQTGGIYRKIGSIAA